MNTTSHTSPRKRSARLLGAAALGLGALLLAGCPNNATEESAENAGPPNARIAVARLAPTQGNQTTGTVTFIEEAQGVRVVADLAKIPEGKHGFHIHENGDCSAPDATSAGGHFNPTNQPHAGPDDEKRHVGDFGNVTASAEQTVKTEWVDAHLTFDGPNSFVGRSVVVHAGPDDLKSQPSGASGDRIACGVIELE